MIIKGELPHWILNEEGLLRVRSYASNEYFSIFLSMNDMHEMAQELLTVEKKMRDDFEKK